MTDMPKFYMDIPLPDGTTTGGRVKYQHYLRKLGLEGLDLSESTVLDVAANDGFWTYWAESAGAKDILAVDVDGFEGYDWGFDGVPAESREAFARNTFGQWSEGGSGFRYLHDLLQSKARKETATVYDLSPEQQGQYDLTFCFGLLYRLRHPLLALDRLRRVTRGALILETMVYNSDEPEAPFAWFYWDDAMKGHTNWTGATEGCVAAWLRSAGFKTIYRTRPNRSIRRTRQVFVALTGDAEYPNFDAAKGLVKFQESYFKRMRKAVRTTHDLTKNAAKSIADD